MKKSFSFKGQKGFTLLELLVVITLLAILSVGALVAYEGIGESASAAAAANNTSSADRAIRNFRAVTQNYPDQWDNLVDATDSTTSFDNDLVASATRFTIGGWDIASATSDVRTQVQGAFAEVGIGALQQIAGGAITAGVEPNLQHNEGSNPSALETDFDLVTDISILPSVEVGGTGLPGVAGTACTAGGQTISAAISTGGTYNGEDVIANDNAYALKLNKINDAMEDDECQLVIALGFGHDAAHSTSGSSVAISTAPTFINRDINPNESYARYIAVFHTGVDEDGDNNIEADEIFDTPRLLAVIDTEGNMIDQNIAAANPSTEDDD